MHIVPAIGLKTMSRFAVSSLLQHPGIAIRIGEIGEACIISVGRVGSRCKTPVPGSNGSLMPNLTDIDTPFEQKAPDGLDVGDDEIDIAD